MSHHCLCCTLDNLIGRDFVIFVDVNVCEILQTMDLIISGTELTNEKKSIFNKSMRYMKLTTVLVFELP